MTESIAFLVPLLPYIGGGMVLIYLFMVFWVARDVAHRTVSGWIQFLFILIVVCLPVLGLFFYLLFRPELLLSKEMKMVMKDS